MSLFRSVIFVPGNRPNMLERALAFNTDVILVDLEDSVPPAEKARARALAQEWVPKLARKGRRVMVRVNSLDTGLTQEDLSAVVGSGLDGISIGKVESAWDIRETDRIITALEPAAGLAPGRIKVVPWIENARAVIAAPQIATVSHRVVAIAFGAEDYTNDMGVQRTDAGEEVYFPRAMVPVAARASRVASLDSPFVRFRDPEGLRRDAEMSRCLGYTGKFAIHPDQLEIINEIFSPSIEEVDYARQVVEAWRRAEAEGRGSVDLNGRMVDVPVLKRAQNLLDLAGAIASQGKQS